MGGASCLWSLKSQPHPSNLLWGRKGEPNYQFMQLQVRMGSKIIIIIIREVVGLIVQIIEKNIRNLHIIKTSGDLIRLNPTHLVNLCFFYCCLCPFPVFCPAPLSLSPCPSLLWSKFFFPSFPKYNPKDGTQDHLFNP